MGVPSIDWLAVSPALLPAAGAVAVLAVDAVLPRGSRAPRWSTAVLDAVALVSLVAALGCLVPLAGQTRETFCSSSGHCSVVAGRLSFALQVVVLSAAVVCLLLAVAERRVALRRGRPGMPRVELLLLLLSTTAGACALATTRDLASFAVALETASLPIVGLAALRRDGRGAEAGLKLLMTAVLSFGLLALGLAFLYASTGSLYLGAPVSSRLGDLTVVHGVGLALVVAGAAFKLSLVPFHLWTPDTYAGASLPVAAFLSTVSKAAGLTAVIVVLGVGAPERSTAWAEPLGAVAVLTMTVGNLVALRQESAVRLLAWSTVAQAGWVVLPLAGAEGQGRVAGAVTSSVAYLLAYSVGTLAVFAVVARVAARHPGGERHGLSAYAGMWRTRPATSLVLAFGLLCLAGMPPGVMGLVAKVVALVPVVGIGAWGLVAVAVANVVLGVAVYLRWAVRLFAEPEPQVATIGAPGTPGSGRGFSSRLALSLAAAGCLTLSVLPEGLVALLGGAPLR